MVTACQHPRRTASVEHRCMRNWICWQRAARLTILCSCACVGRRRWHMESCHMARADGHAVRTKRSWAPTRISSRWDAAHTSPSQNSAAPEMLFDAYAQHGRTRITNVLERVSGPVARAEPPACVRGKMGHRIMQGGVGACAPHAMLYTLASMASRCRCA